MEHFPHAGFGIVIDSLVTDWSLTVNDNNYNFD